MHTNKSALAGPSRPLGSPEIPQFHLPSNVEAGVYVPQLYGAAHIHFADKKRKLDETRRVAFLLPLDPTTRTVDWDLAAPVDVMPENLPSGAPREAPYLPLPRGAMDTTVFARWAKSFDRWLARTQRISVEARPEAPGIVIGPKRGGVSVDLVAIVWALS